MEVIRLRTSRAKELVVKGAKAKLKFLIEEDI